MSHQKAQVVFQRDTKRKNIGSNFFAELERELKRFFDDNYDVKCVEFDVKPITIGTYTAFIVCFETVGREVVGRICYNRTFRNAAQFIGELTDEPITLCFQNERLNGYLAYTPSTYDQITIEKLFV